MNRSTKTQTAIGIATLVTASLASYAGSTVSWAAASNGSWGTAGNWTPMMIPGIADDAVIGLNGFYVVSVNSLESAASLSITNSDAFLEINSAHSLSLFGDLANEGTILINPVSGGSLTTLYFDTNAMISGTGSIQLNGFGPRARMTAGPGQMITNGELHTIEGFGQIEAGLLNDGLIRANVIDNELSLRNSDMQNNNVMEAVDGAVLNISGITLSNTGMGAVRAAGPDAEVRLTGSTIMGGLLSTNNGGQMSVTNASVLDGVEADADLRVLNSHVLNIRNSIINNGEITVNPVSGDSETSIAFLDSSNLEGSGTVTLNGFGVRANLIADEGIQVTNSLNHSIQGKGQIEASLRNLGLVSANVVAEELALMTFPKVNDSIMEAINGGILSILGTSIDQSAISAGANGFGTTGSIVAIGTDSTIQIAGSQIIGGSVETYNDANVVITCATTFDDVAFSGIMRILNSHRLILLEGTTNDGMILVNPAGGEGVTFVEWGEEMSLEGEGVISLLASGARSQLIGADGVEFGELGANQRLEGIGQISLNLINSGEIAPGFSVGTITAIEPVSLSPTSVFEAEISPANSDLLRSVSTVDLGGRLDVEFIDGFAPDEFWARTIVESTSITNTFDEVDFPAPPFGLVSKVYNTGTELIIGQTCPIDFNIDNELDFFDVSLFLEAYEAQDLMADLNGDGLLTFFDVSIFMVEFQNGCKIGKSK